MDSAAPPYPANPPPPIPVDLIVSKSPVDLTHRRLTVRDACGNLLFKARPWFHSDRVSRRGYRALLDPENKPIVSLFRSPDGGWQGYRGENNESKDLIFRVQSMHSHMRTELKVFLVGDNCFNSTSNLRIIGSPLQRSCTIYKDDSILAQTSPLYKLGKVLVGRHRFRLTIYPGSDHILLVALLVIFFDAET